MTTIHVHAFPLASHRSLLDTARDSLSAEELERGARFKVDAARDEFLLSRILLRRTLAAHLDRPVGQVVLALSPYGKPYLSLAGQAGLEFNLSHSHGRLLIAVCRGHPVGIDIERVDPSIDPVQMGRTGLPSEDQRQLEAAAEDRRHDLFFTFWTRWEACLKAFGRGFLAAPQGLSRTMLADTILVREAAEAGQAAARCAVIRDLPVDAGFKAAVALSAEGAPPAVPDIEWHGLP